MKKAVMVPTLLTCALGFIAVGQSALADEVVVAHGESAQEYIHGRPDNPTEAWTLAAGGRIYDTWWDALDREEPEGTHPSYPAAGGAEGETTWRCKSCHGWDYLGRDGIYSKGSNYTGVKGIDGAIGMPEADIMALLRAPLHGYTPEMITDDELSRVAAFVNRGQVDMRRFIAIPERRLIAGDPGRGAELFQTTCAACHGYDGRALNWGEDGENNYVGTEAAALPDEVIHKILNAHPGAQMINLRALPLSDAIDVLAYAATLPTD